ncbi:hypothetical protein [Amphiplicatus metriothermophilus]|uniref:hypothetical protein n=1 Tax=Amphiplicatus metriothermophilus TaxID=1519374 RepID=UPI001177B7FE|nr:hypothetical protein [Amphiplicatus metriothermophilus]MBB5518342.1 hypothetical protein [Amphiplicatus metriothermophilus]
MLATSISAAIVLCNIAYGQTAEYEDLTIEEALQICAAFPDASERLACFEALAASARDETLGSSASSDSGSSAAGAEKSPLSLRDSSERGRQDSAESLETEVDNPAITKSKPRFTFTRSTEEEQKRKNRQRFELTVYRAWRNPVGDLRIAFTNGEIWVQTGRGTRYTPEPGETITFKPGLLGGWTLSMNGGRFGIRARRINEPD